MEVPAVDDLLDFPNVSETNCMMETLGDTLLDSSVMEENNFVEQNTTSNSLEVEERNAEEILDSPPKKRKRQNFKTVLKKRARKYLGMKGHELRTILMNDAFKFCQEYNLLAKTAICSCGVSMNLTPSKQCSDRIVWSCRKGGHGNSVTVRKNSFFENSKISLSDSLWIMYMWVHEYSYVSMLHEIDIFNQRLEDWCNKCRDACHPILETKTNPIGGPDKIIEVFEAKFKDAQDSKKKRRKGVSEQWIFCAVEQFSSNCVYVSVPDKKMHTVCEILDKYILPGTKVYSHLWNVYFNLDEVSYDYLTKEKLLLFYDCNSKADIRSYKRFQNVAEQPHPSLNYWDKSEFCEFMYRKSLYFAPDAFLAFLKDLALVCSPEGGIIKKNNPIPKPEKKEEVLKSENGQEVLKSENDQEKVSKSENGQKEVSKSENGGEVLSEPENSEEELSKPENSEGCQLNVTKSGNNIESQEKVTELEKK